MSWKVLPRENCKLLQDQGLKLLRKSLGLSVQFLTQHCISAGRSFNHTQFFFPLCDESQFFTVLSYASLSPTSSWGWVRCPWWTEECHQVCLEQKSIYPILSISWPVLWKQEISRNTECFVCWTGLETSNTTKFTVREFLMKSLLLFVPYSMVCYCWGGLLSANWNWARSAFLVIARTWSFKKCKKYWQKSYCRQINIKLKALLLV